LELVVWRAPSSVPLRQWHWPLNVKHGCVAVRLRRKIVFESLEDRNLLATFNWVGGIDGNWNTAGNWGLVVGSGTDNGTAGVPDAGDSAVFSAVTGQSINQNIAGLALISNAAGGYTLSGS
jgi:hypothetical protein